MTARTHSLRISAKKLRWRRRWVWKARAFSLKWSNGGVRRGKKLKFRFFSLLFISFDEDPIHIFFSHRVFSNWNFLLSHDFFSLLSRHLQWKINLKWIFKWSWHQFPANFRPTSLTTQTEVQSQPFSGRSKKISAQFYLIFQLKRKFFTFFSSSRINQMFSFISILHPTFSPN